MTAPARLLALFLPVLGILELVPSIRAAEVDYERDLLPILMEKCAECHSTQSEKLKGGLKFDDPAHFQRSFGENGPVVPGNWDASQLFLTVFRPSSDKSAMPPKGKGERLNLAEVKLVMQWIAEGAPINGERGPRGPMPENIEDLFLDLPPETADQLRKELAIPPGGQPTPSRPDPPRERDWTNREGKTIRATLLRVMGDDAVLRLPDGREVTYPLANLSEESRRIAQEQK